MGGGQVNVITIALPKKVLKALERRSAAEGRAVEEFISETVLERLGISDPEARTELHLKLCEKYMREAEELLARGRTTSKRRRRPGAPHPRWSRH